MNTQLSKMSRNIKTLKSQIQDDKTLENALISRKDYFDSQFRDYYMNHRKAITQDDQKKDYRINRAKT